MEALLNAIRESLVAITNPRFYDTERGFQGELCAELRNRLPYLELDGAIVEQEHQKRMKSHGFRIRPDLIIHIPFERSGFTTRAEGNFVAIALKLRANARRAMTDFENLSAMCETLDYPLGIFINIDDTETHLNEFGGQNKELLRAFAVKLVDGEVVINEQQFT